MPIKRKTINLSVDGEKLVAMDPETGNPVSSAGCQGEDGAVWLHADIPDDWSDLRVRLQIISASGTCDISGLPLSGAIDMPLRKNITVPGRLKIALTGSSQDGVRRTAECDSLFIAENDCPVDPVSEVYPIAFENLCNVVDHVVHKISGSGGAKVTKIDDTTYDINVSGTGGDMLAANYAAGTGQANKNTVDHAVYADKTGNVEEALHAKSADTADSASDAAAGSKLETAVNSKQPLLSPGGNGGVDLLSGTVVKSLKGNNLTLNSDDKSVTLGIDGGVAKAGSIMYIASSKLIDGWQFADGRLMKVSDYPNLFNAIGYKFGKGTVNCVHVCPKYFTDNCNIASDIVLEKYSDGIRDTSYFAAAGTVFSGNEFILTKSGDYTVYCKDSSGHEAVQYVCVPPLTAAYVLSLNSTPIMSNLKIGVFGVISENVTINLEKLASGIQTTSYFASNGTTIGTSISTCYYFQSGTSMASGTYTWYTKDTNGNEQIQYFKVNTAKTLSISLTLYFGSDYFMLPNLVGTIDSSLLPLIKL